MTKNLIEITLKENIKNPSAVFVFPTQTAAELWADKIIFISEVSALAMNRFLAWDTFKGQSIKGQHQDKTSIPSAMRQIFAANIISQNAENPFLKNLIIPEYAKTASGFENWICSLLPSLKNWKTKFDKSNQKADDEDCDLLNLYEKYSDFLEENNFFDPAWETPPFQKDGNKYFIFFPEILSDYFEYEEILKSSEDITIINLPKTDDKISDVQFFNNSRIELKNVADYCRKIHEDKENPIAWDQIAISIPNMETYGLYLDRELTLAQIPHLMRYAKPLSSVGAGGLFNQINECANSNFSYNSIKALILNSELPWKDKNAIKQLIAFGKKNHCICSFNYQNKLVDVWESSFKENPKEEVAHNFYKILKKDIQNLKNSKTFSEVRDRYFNLRNDLFDMDQCSKQADLILSRCISELGSLLDLEEDFPNICKVSSPYDFFTNYISDINYLEQSEERGIQIYPYKLAASAPFDCHIILDSSQASLSIVYKQLAFLRDDKRLNLLGREDPNVTEKFLALYSMNSYKCPAYFTAANKTFDAYSQTCSYLNEIDLRKENDEIKLFGKNPYKIEENWLLNSDLEFPKKITEIQKIGMENWKFTQNLKNSDKNLEKSQEFVKEFVNSTKLKFSTTQLKSYENCPRCWLFEKRLNLQEENNAAVLMDYFQMGNLYHKIFELYLKNLNGKAIHIEHDQNGIPTDLSEEYKNILDKSITDAINDYENPYLTKQILSTTRRALEKIVEESIKKFSDTFDGCFLENSEGEFSYEDEHKAYDCYGRIDCLLRDPTDNDTILIDFKSSASAIPSNLYLDPEDPDAKPDFQMPMYIYLLRNQQKPVTVDNACFYDVTKGNCTIVFGHNLGERLGKDLSKVPEKEAFEDTIKYLLDYMDNMAEKIKEGDFSPDPEIQDYSYCRACSHNNICRRTFNVGKKD
ncbi:MAG: PD-(D/E)XK nuclease family protein [Treponema sp.]|nr:PD-(D/E)XK nuclease family protein [Treponema sp.]